MKPWNHARSSTVSIKNLSEQSPRGRSALRAALRIEGLESRCLLAADLLSVASLASSSIVADPPTASDLRREVVESKVAFVETDFYFAGEERIGLGEEAYQVAVGFDESILPQLPGEFTFVRGVTPGVEIYESSRPIDADLRAELSRATGVEFVVPVFVSAKTQSQAVLLNEVVVALRPETTPDEFFNEHQDLVASYRPLLGTTDQFVVEVAAERGSATLEIANRWQSDKRLEWSAPNFYQMWERYYTPNDPRFGNQWHLENTGQGGGLVDADPDLTAAWDVNPGGSPEIVVGVIDDGIAIDHPDLLHFRNPGEIEGNGIDDDGNGWIDDVYGWNFVRNNNAAGPLSTGDAHGTSVAGVAAARGDNGTGVTGAAYRSSVISGKMFDGSNFANDAGIAQAFYYMAGRNANGIGTWRSADVVNNSWGGGSSSAIMTAALVWGTTQGRQGAGVAYLFATGNGFGSVSEPAVQSRNIPGVIAVGATNNRGELSDYSNTGPAVDIVAPSNDSRSGYLAIDTTDLLGNAGYAAGDYTGTGGTGFGGTSSATPLASGIAALALAEMASRGIAITPAQLRDLLRANTDLIGNGEYGLETGHNLQFGYGRLNAGNLLRSIGGPEISVLTETHELVDGGSAIDVGSVVVGTSETFSLRIRNQGTADLVLSDIVVDSGPFSIASAFSSSTLRMGESTTIAIAFSPMTAGANVGQVSLLSNDADEAAFKIPIDGVGLVASVSGLTFEDWNGDGVRDQGEPAVPGRVVYLDTNNNSILDQTVTTFASTTSVAIPDNGSIQSPVTVGGILQAVGSVEVEVNLTHTYNSDLVVSLVGPDGREVVLANRVGGSNDNFISTVFTDSAASSIREGTAPFTGNFRPEQSLSAFNNLNPNGVWNLRVRDVEGGDIGRINSWRLRLVNGEDVQTTNSAGNYSFLNLPIGDYRIRALNDGRWTTTFADGYAFSINGVNDSNPARNFGVGQNNRFYATVFEDVNENGVLEVGEDGLAGRRIFHDRNENGVFDPAVASSYVNNASVPLPDLATTFSSITIPETSDVIRDLNLRLDITHTWVGDLITVLIAPDGTRARLFSQVGSAGDNFVNTLLDDQASTGIASGSAPFSGSYRPQDPLSVFNGKSVVGTWTLQITDNAFLDIGRLNRWELIITSDSDLSATTDANGYAFIDLPAGSQTIASVSTSGWIATSPTSLDVNAAGSPLFARVFGSVEDRPNILSRAMFYNNASGVSSVGSAQQAVDTSKRVLLPGETSTFANYSNYALGLNGLLFDLARPLTTMTESSLLANMQFAVWNGIDAGGFTQLPSQAEPTVEFVAAGGTNESTRVKLTFRDESIKNTWLRVTVLANSTTGLARNDVFYFGNVVGDVDVGNTSDRIRVNSIDTALIRSQQSPEVSSATASNPFDLNRDGRVNAIDTAIVRTNQQVEGIVAPLTAPSRAAFSGGNAGRGNKVLSATAPDTLPERDDDEAATKPAPEQAKLAAVENSDDSAQNAHSVLLAAAWSASLPVIGDIDLPRTRSVEIADADEAVPNITVCENTSLASAPNEQSTGNVFSNRGARAAKQLADADSSTDVRNRSVDIAIDEVLFEISFLGKI